MNVVKYLSRKEKYFRNSIDSEVIFFDLELLSCQFK